MNLLGLLANSRNSPVLWLARVGQLYGSAEGCVRVSRTATAMLPALFLLSTTREEIYNVLWALVFGFATLNILSLGARRFESARSGLNFGEVLAVLVVIVSVILLGWELLYTFHILPLRITPS